MSKEPRAARSLILELDSRTVVIKGQRTELPIKEFELLAALAARPGQAVSTRDLIERMWPDSSAMTSVDLHWYVWSLRKLLRGATGESKLIGNRRGYGYLLDLPSKAVEIGESKTVNTEVHEQVVSEDPGRSGPDRPIPLVEGPQSKTPAANDTLVPPVTRRSGTVAASVVGIAIVLALSWVVGYWLAQPVGTEIGQTPRPSVSSQSPTPAESRPTPDKDPSSDNKGQDGRQKKDSRNGGNGRGTENGGGVLVAGGDTTITNPNDGGQVDSGSSSGNRAQDPRSHSPKEPPSGKEPKPPADSPDPPPQPDAILYHLFNPDSEDHQATTSSSVANQKQASGYRVSNEGRVFTSQVAGTVAISLSDGAAYVYKDSGSAPAGASIAALYRLSGDNDSFYTTSSSEVNQARAKGWSISTVGYATV